MVSSYTAILLAQATPNNADPNLAFIINIVVALIAATPPTITALTTVLTNLRNELEKGKSPTPKVIKVARQPLDERKWKKTKRRFLITTILMFSVVLFISINSSLYFLSLPYITLAKQVSNFGTLPFLGYKINVLVTTNFLLFLLYSISFFRAYRRLGRNPNDSKLFLFEKAFIILEANYESVFSRCQETLRILGAEIIEFNPEQNLLEAATSSGLINLFGGVFQIEISELKDHNPARVELVVRFLASVSDLTMSLNKSTNINRFIRFFLSR